MAIMKEETARGNERIQQLMEGFPEISRRMVVKADVLREGIGLNETTRQLGRWALPDAPWYFEYNIEAAHKGEEKAEGYLLSPLVGYFEDSSSFFFLADSRSPYEVCYEERGRYRLYRDGEPLEELFFTPRPQWYDKKTSSGRPMPSVVAQRGEDNLCIAALSSCGYGKDTCRYCNINPAESVNKELGLERLTAKQDQDLYETLVAACQEVKQRTMVPLSGGVILDPSKEADMYARILKVIRRAEKDVGYETPIAVMVKSQAMEPEDVMKLKEAGVTSLGFNTEVWDPKLFEYICPGKAKYVGRERWLERLVRAVDVLGEGRVVTSLVIGLEMAPPYGFKSEDEGEASYLEGFKWMLDHKVIPGGVPWRPVSGTIFEGTEPPSTEYILRLELARFKMLVQYNKVRKPARLSGSPGLSISSELGFYGLQGVPAAGPSQGAGPSPDPAVC